MIRRFAFLVPVIALAVAVPATSALATTDFQGTVTQQKAFEWDGNIFAAANVGDPADCGKDPTNYCDTALVRFDLPVPDDLLPPPSSEPQTVTYTATASIGIGNFTPFPDCDFDLFIYSSDANGSVGDEMGSSTGSFGEQEKVTMDIESTATVNPDGSVERHDSTYLLVKVVYWFVPASQYHGTAKFLA